MPPIAAWQHHLRAEGSTPWECRTVPWGDSSTTLSPDWQKRTKHDRWSGTPREWHPLSHCLISHSGVSLSPRVTYCFPAAGGFQVGHSERSRGSIASRNTGSSASADNDICVNVKAGVVFDPGY